MSYESTVMEAPHILNQKARLSISSQNTQELNSLICPQVVNKSLFFCQDHIRERREKAKEKEPEREREKESEMHSREEKKKDDLLNLKFFYVLLLHLEIWLSRVAAGSRDLRMDM